MSTAKTLAKLQAFKKNPEVFQSLSNEELADLVIVVLSQVNTISTNIKEGRLDGKTPKEDVEYLGRKSALSIINKGLSEASSTLKNDINNAIQSLELKGGELDNRVAESIARLRDGKDGIVSEEEIQRAASVALSMLELPDFDALVTEAITTNSEAVRNALELLAGENRYTVEIPDVKGLKDALNELARIRTTGGGTIGKQQVYGFIRQAIADGTITAGGSSLPDQTGNNGKFLTTDGTDPAWASIPGGGDMLAATYDPANGAKQVAFNDEVNRNITVQTPSGIINGVNTVFTFTKIPQWIVSDGVTYFENFGYMMLGFTATLDVAPASFIRGVGEMQYDNIVWEDGQNAVWEDGDNAVYEF